MHAFHQLDFELIRKDHNIGPNPSIDHESLFDTLNVCNGYRHTLKVLKETLSVRKISILPSFPSVPVFNYLQ